MQQLVLPLMEPIQQRLAAQDQDQEVKEAAISCAATIVAVMGDVTGTAYLALVKVHALHHFPSHILCLSLGRTNCAWTHLLLSGHLCMVYLSCSDVSLVHHVIF